MANPYYSRAESLAGLSGNVDNLVGQLQNKEALRLREEDQKSAASLRAGQLSGMRQEQDILDEKQGLAEAYQAASYVKQATTLEDQNRRIDEVTRKYSDREDIMDMANVLKETPFEEANDLLTEVETQVQQERLNKGYIKAPEAAKARPTTKATVMRGGVPTEVLFDSQTGDPIRVLGESKPAGNGVSVTVGGQEKKFDETVGGDLGTLQKTNKDAIAQNNRALQSLEAMKASKNRANPDGLNSFLQGKLSVPTKYILSLAEAIGITDAKGLSETELRESLTLSLARDDLAPGERPTDADIAQLIKAAPNSGDTEFGFKVKLGTKIAVNKYKNAAAKAENRAIDKLRSENRLTYSNVEDEMTTWREQNPIDDYYQKELGEYLNSDKTDIEEGVTDWRDL